MGQVRKYPGPPSRFSFHKDDLWLDTKNGDIYFKDFKQNLKKLFKEGDKLKTIAVGTVSGSNIVTHNITASGHISASGIIYADNFQSHGSAEIKIVDSLNITGSISASGNISASGEMTANTGSFNLIEGGVF